MEKQFQLFFGFLFMIFLNFFYINSCQHENDNIVQDFEKIQLSTTFYAEGVAIGDLNGNGLNDVVCGPYWYEGPEFDQRYEYYEPQEFDPLEYSDNFIAATGDVNGNGRNDILIVGFPGLEAYWYENPQDNQGYWTRHLIYPAVDNESPAFVDLTGDGNLELVFHTDGYLGYARPDMDNSEQPWQFLPVSLQGEWGRYNHGLGVGDINGNGYSDIIMSEGWWENPGPDWDQEAPWAHHPVDFGPGGAQMYIYDVDRDGLNDVITSREAHGWGLAWYRQVRTDSGIHFEKQLIMGDSIDDNPYGVRFSQIHALTLADMNNNGIQGIVTGKRFWAHGPEGDPEPNAPAVIYWFEPEMESNGQVNYVPHLIDDDSGVGTQITAGDLTGNGYPDIASCNKKGAFVFLNRFENLQ